MIGFTDAAGCCGVELELEVVAAACWSSRVVLCSEFLEDDSFAVFLDEPVVEEFLLLSGVERRELDVCLFAEFGMDAGGESQEHGGSFLDGQGSDAVSVLEDVEDVQCVPDEFAVQQVGFSEEGGLLSYFVRDADGLALPVEGVDSLPVSEHEPDAVEFGLCGPFGIIEQSEGLLLLHGVQKDAQGFRGGFGRVGLRDSAVGFGHVPVALCHLAFHKVVPDFCRLFQADGFARLASGVHAGSAAAVFEVYDVPAVLLFDGGVVHLVAASLSVVEACVLHGFKSPWLSFFRGGIRGSEPFRRSLSQFFFFQISPPLWHIYFGVWLSHGSPRTSIFRATSFGMQSPRSFSWLSAGLPVP